MGRRTRRIGSVAGVDGTVRVHKLGPGMGSGPETSDLPNAPYVLVVEDDPVLRTFLLEALADEGIAAAGVDDGLPALHLAVRRCPLVILLDHQTPNMGGEAFARLYRALPGPHAPLVLMTGHPQAELLAREMGADGMLSKPFDLEELGHLLRRFSCAPVAA